MTGFSEKPYSALLVIFVDSLVQVRTHLIYNEEVFRKPTMPPGRGSKEEKTRLMETTYERPQKTPNSPQNYNLIPT